MYILLRTTLLAALVAATASVSSAQPADAPVSIVTFNILAPCWASPDYYPPEAAPLLDAAYRRQRIINFLNSATQSGADVLALQEVTGTEFAYIKAALDKEFVASNSYHAPTYWANWITISPPWEPNGNALLLRRSRFRNVVFRDLVLAADGNHAVGAEAQLANSRKRVRIASIHLDSNHSYSREAELRSLLDQMPKAPETTDIVAGDFNIDIDRTSLQDNLKVAGFQSVLSTLGITTTTSPFGTYNRHSAYGQIHQVTVRNAAPVSAAVIDCGLLTLYPSSKEDAARIVANFQVSGSDHFPVTAVVAPTP